MATQVSEGVTQRENKSIIQKHSYQDYLLIYSELGVLDKATRELWLLAMTTEDEKLKADILKWFVESGIGRATQRTDITTNGESISSGVIIKWEDDDEDIRTT
jgi:hypothetical protein